MQFLAGVQAVRGKVGVVGDCSQAKLARAFEQLKFSEGWLEDDGEVFPLVPDQSPWLRSLALSPVSLDEASELPDVALLEPLHTDPGGARLSRGSVEENSLAQRNAPEETGFVEAGTYIGVAEVGSRTASWGMGRHYLR